MLKKGCLLDFFGSCFKKKLCTKEAVKLSINLIMMTRNKDIDHAFLDQFYTCQKKTKLRTPELHMFLENLVCIALHPKNQLLYPNTLTRTSEPINDILKSIYGKH